MRRSDIAGCDFVAVVSPRFIKSDIKFMWGIGRELNGAVELVINLHAAGHSLQHLGDHHVLAKTLNHWFARRTLTDAARANRDVHR